MVRLKAFKLDIANNNLMICLHFLNRMFYRNKITMAFLKSVHKELFVFLKSKILKHEQNNLTTCDMHFGCFRISN